MKIVCLLLIAHLFACKEKVLKTGEIKSHPAHHHDRSSSPTTDDYASQVNAGYIPEDTMRGSPKRVAMNTIGKTHVHIEYASPGTKERVIWGGVVPYKEIWVTGAHQATSININKPIVINETIIPKGIYAFFTIPSKKNWMGIINRDYEQHLTDNYDSTKDVLRFPITPFTNDRFVKRLTYSVHNLDDTSGMINMEWERIKISIDFKTVNN